MSFEMLDNVNQDAVIKVIGVGGGGGNAVQNMIESGIEGIDFICANTDAQALRRINTQCTIQIGAGVTKGLGAGAKPEMGRQAALEDRERIQEIVAGADMLFLTAGMGGGTGTGAIPVIAQIARELGILTVAVVTKPFSHEGRRRMQYAETGIAELKEYVDSLIVVPNDKLTGLGGEMDFFDTFKESDNVLSRAVGGISEIITKEGYINVDFADVRTVMSEMGNAMMGQGVAKGDDRAREATERAIHSPLLEDVDIKGARGVLVNVVASRKGFKIEEYNEIMAIVEELAHEDAELIQGMGFDEEMQDEVKVTIIATGLGVKDQPELKVVENKPKTEMTPAPVTAIQQEEAQPEAALPSYDPTGSDYFDIPAFLRRQAD